MTLIVGGDSRIGAALATELESRGLPFANTSRRGAGGLRLDLAENPSNWLIPSCRSAVLCGAMTRLDHCEREPELARRINTDAVGELARRFAERGTYFVFLSTNLVFDGSKAMPMASDLVCPSTVYGDLKARAEEKARNASPERSAILRLTKVLGPGHERLTAWGRDLSAGRTLSAFDDMPLAPVGLRQVVGALVGLLENEVAGTFHLSANHDVTWFDLALAFARARGVDETMVRRSSAAEAGLDPPAHSALGMGELELAQGWKAQDPWQALQEAI